MILFFNTKTNLLNSYLIQQTKKLKKEKIMRKRINTKNELANMRNYKIEDEAIVKYLKVFYKIMIDSTDKITVKDILDTREFNRDNASLFTLSLKDMLVNDFYSQILKENNEAFFLIKTLYSYFYNYFDVNWISREIGYGCYDKKMAIFTLYLNDDNREVA